MSFIEIICNNRKKLAIQNLNKIRILCRYRKNIGNQNIIYNANICIGRHICEKLNINVKDTVSFFYEEHAPEVWLVKKSPNKSGFMICGKDNSTYLYFTIPSFIVNMCNVKNNPDVIFESNESGLTIYSDKSY